MRRESESQKRHASKQTAAKQRNLEVEATIRGNREVTDMLVGFDRSYLSVPKVSVKEASLKHVTVYCYY